MIYRVAVLSAILLAGMGFTMPAYAAGHKWVLQGTCSKSSIAESNGVQARPANGEMSTKDYLALMKRVRDAHQSLGADGFVWTEQPLHCDSMAVVQMDDYQGHTMVTFSNGDPKNPILGFAGGRVDGDGPLFFSDTVYLADGKALPLNQGGTGQGCHFNFTDHGTFTQGWENRLTTIECDLRVKTDIGHLINANVTFDVSQPPPIPKPSRDPATSKPQDLP
jgi:hypothetical protein